MPAPAYRATAVERAYGRLREQILDGTLAPRRLLSEGEVAAELGVSRTPVREAFVQLAAEGMLELYPKRGALVVPVGAIELRDVLLARALVEPWAAAAVACLPGRASAIAEMRAATATARDALADGDDRAFQEADRAFHDRLMDAAGNDLLAGFHRSLRDRQLRAGTIAMRNDPRRAGEIMSQHDLIADALEAGDAQEAGAIMRRHLDDSARALGLAPL